jgi:hypothetical protein
MRRLTVIVCICLFALPSWGGRRGGLPTTLPFQFGIWSDNTSGTAPVLLVEDQLHEISHVHVSPDGTKIAWTRWNVYDPTIGFYTENASVAGAETFVADITGANKISLGRNTLNHGNSWWAPDNSGVYFNSSNNPCGNINGINFYNLSTKATTTILSDSPTCRFSYGDPTVTGAGAGTTLVVGGADTFTTNAQSYLFTYNLSSHVLTQLNTPSIPSFPRSGPGPGDYDPKFNHAGTYVATNRHVGVNCYHIVVTKLSDGTWTDLTDAGQACPTPQGTLAINGNPEFNFADDTIVYWHADTNPANKGIWTIPFVGGSPTHISIALAIPPNGLLKMPTWSTQSGSASTIYYSSFNITLPNIAPAPTNITPPTLSGTFTTGQTLTASTGSWNSCGSCTYTYLFYREGFAQGTRSSTNTYALTAADLGARFSVDVIASNSGGVSSPALSLVSVPVISTTVRYVSFTDGLDTNNGTTSTPGAPNGPWKTLAQVSTGLGASTSAPTSVLLKAGDTWRERFKPTTIASSTNPLVIDSYGSGAQPLILGSVAESSTSNWTTTGTTNVWKSVDTFPPASHFSVTFSGAPSTAVVTWSGITPVNGRGVAFYGTLPGGINAGQGYFIVGASGSTSNLSLTPGGAAITVSSNGSGVTAGVNGNPTNDGNNANDVGNFIFTLSGVIQAGNSASTSTTIYNIWTGQSDSLLTTQWQWYFSISDWRVHVYSVGNPASFAGVSSIELAINKVGFIPTNQHYVTIQNIAISNFAGTAMNFLQSDHVTARDMTISWIGGGNLNGDNVRYGDALDIELTSSNHMFERNFVSQCYDSGPSIQPIVSGDTISNVTFRNNIIEHGTQGSISLITSGNAITNTAFYNNTVYNVVGWSENQRWNNSGQTESNQRFGLYHSGSSPAPTNYLNENNAYTFLGSSCSINGTAGGYYDWTAAGKMLIDYNLWSRQDGTAPVYCQDGTNSETLQLWSNGSSFQEKHGLIGTAPSFTDPTNNNFTPLAGSPLRNAGTNLYSAGVVWDFNRLPRPAAGNFTMGAIQ